MSWTVRPGDCVEQMRDLDEESFDSVVTDPPYGIRFMGKAWDGADIVHRTKTQASKRPRPDGRTSQRTRRRPRPATYDESPSANRAFQDWCEQWSGEVLRLLKPGGHLLAFGGTRTYHRLACAVEDAGFEIRDSLIWLYGSGFPKSRNGEWGGTALKPGHEPIVMGRKPLAGTTQENWREHGTGGLNIDGCRIPVVVDQYERNASGDRCHDGTRELEDRGATDLRMGGGSAAGARWPANVAMDPAAAADLDRQTGILTSGANPARRASDKFRDVFGDFAGQAECDPARGADSGGASRFFYCAKASRAERDAGCEAIDKKPLSWSSGDQSPGTFQADGTEKAARNAHPTVKPIELMRWLVRLVTPGGGLVLDPFCGSGTTGCAAVLEGFDFLGIEREEEYVETARARIEHASSQPVQLGLDAAT